MNESQTLYMARLRDDQLDEDKVQTKQTGRASIQMKKPSVDFNAIGGPNKVSAPVAQQSASSKGKGAGSFLKSMAVSLRKMVAKRLPGSSSSAAKNKSSSASKSRLDLEQQQFEEAIEQNSVLNS